MTDREIHRLQDMLLTRRTELLDRVKKVESGWDDLKEVAIEMEEEAQKLSITEPLDRIDEEGKDQIGLIDLALKKIPLGDYGICEGCGDDIPVRRLEAIPWARLCIDCAREYEKKGLTLEEPAEVIRPAPLPDDQTARPGRLPDDFEGLSEEQVEARIMDQIEADGRIDTDELVISFKDGILYLEGSLAGVPEHQILMQTLTDVLGFSSIVDHLVVDETLWEREDRTPEPPSEKPSVKEQMFYREEEMTEDLFEAQYQENETPFTPPERPLPHQEGEPLE